MREAEEVALGAEVAALRQANKELLGALQAWIDDFGGGPIADWNAADGERVQYIVNTARAALSRYGAEPGTANESDPSHSGTPEAK